MWGLCQNVEIIHEHHHHFYEVVLPAKPRNRSLLSHSANPESLPPTPSPSSASFAREPPQEAYSSKFYRSKRAYLHGSQRGIEVLSRRQDCSFQLSRINLQKAGENQLPQYCHLPPANTSQPQRLVDCHTPRVMQERRRLPDVVFSAPPTKDSNSRPQEQKINESLNQSLQKSIPTVCKNASTGRGNQYYHCHQLKQSKMGFNHTSIFETKRKNRQICNQTANNISLSIPADLSSKPKHYYHQSSEIYLRDKDSIVTKKQTELLTAFKTEKMFDDAKSIISLESLDNSRLNIDESIIVNRTMDYFACVTQTKELPCCSLYLAKEKTINWLVTVREFEFKYEENFLKEARVYASLSQVEPFGEREWESLPYLQLYRMMMEGSGLSKNIFFIMQPFQVLLDDHLASKKSYFKSVPSAFNYFLQDFAEQLLQALTLLGEKKLALIEPLQIGDLAIANGRFKFHSLTKFEAVRTPLHPSREQILASVQKMRSSIIEQVIFG